MKFGRSVQLYVKKHYIMTLVMIVIVVAAILYFNKIRIFENYVSKIADSKNKNVALSFSGTSENKGTSACTIYKVGYNPSVGANFFYGDGNDTFTLFKNSTNITGKSGDYGWVLSMIGQNNGNGTYSYDASFLFNNKKISFDTAADSDTGVMVNNMKNTKYVNIYNQSVVNKSKVVVKALNIKQPQMFISLKFV